MKQITEDYCNKEISVLLMEKGFDVPVKNYFSLNKDAILHNLDKQFGEKKNWNHFEYCISRPSQSIALKWLREVHNIAIDTEWEHLWYAYVKPMTSNPFEDDYYQCSSVKYEEAVEAALKYTLENLI